MKTLNTKFLFVMVLALAACGGNPPVEKAQPMVVTDSVVWNGDPDLAPLLVRPQLGAAEWEAAGRIEARIGGSAFLDRLGAAAEDNSAPWLVRLNALRVLENRRAVTQLGAFGAAMNASDERVRIASVAAMREFMGVSAASARQILVMGLHDPSPRVQTAALQVLADRDVEPLRDYLGRTKNAELRTIALDLIRAAEERGAPLVPDANGNIERVTASGVKLTYRPTTRWPAWDASVGELTVTPAGKKAALVAKGVEVVGNVVPAFFTSDGTTLVYEVDRTIHTYNLVTGADVKLADGIAPRILPFTNDVIYFVEDPDRRIETRDGFSLRYNVFRIPAAGGTATSIGQFGASLRQDLKGNYSAVRWSRIFEQDGEFYLSGPNITFRLPSPFAT
jgi:hypothetical protein